MQTGAATSMPCLSWRYTTFGKWIEFGRRRGICNTLATVSAQADHCHARRDFSRQPSRV